RTHVSSPRPDALRAWRARHSKEPTGRRIKWTAQTLRRSDAFGSLSVNCRRFQEPLASLRSSHALTESALDEDPRGATSSASDALSLTRAAHRVRVGCPWERTGAG